MKIKNLHHSRIWRRFWPQTGFFQKKPFWPIFTISKFSKPENFVIFGFPSKSFFFWTTKLLLFHQKHFWVGSEKIRKNFDMFGGGGVKNRPYFPPPRKKIVDFARIVVKRVKKKNYVITRCRIPSCSIGRTTFTTTTHLIGFKVVGIPFTTIIRIVFVPFTINSLIISSCTF